MKYCEIGECPVCLEGKIQLVEHHCHLWETVIASARLIIEPVYGRTRAEYMPSQKQWSDDPRFPYVWRFDPVKICEQCNLIDGCDLETVPGVNFSLSFDEMRSIRDLTGNRVNSGEVFIAELRRVRFVATLDYLERFERASTLGFEMALEWIVEETSQTRIT